MADGGNEHPDKLAHNVTLNVSVKSPRFSNVTFMLKQVPTEITVLEAITLLITILWSPAVTVALLDVACPPTLSSTFARIV
jgi:hypothetical protein